MGAPNVPAKVYTVTPGLVLRIGTCGEASNDVPAIVPDEVADQLEAEIRGLEGRAKRKDIRVERIRKTPPAAAAAQPTAAKTEKPALKGQEG
jgi:hypothetical protein